MLDALPQRIKSVARRLLRPPLHRAEISVPHTVYGTEYGGWPLIDGTIDAASEILSVGLGEDVSFDLAAIDRFGCRVHGCDPTPKSLAWVRGQVLPQRFLLYPLGLGEEDGTVEVIPPADERHVSFSATRGRDQGGAAVTIEICSLPTLMARIGLTRVDALKMDIEGFEYGVVDALVAGTILPPQLLIEFHHGMYTYTAADTNRAVERLRAIGYRIFYVSSGGHEYGFVRETTA